MIKNIISLVILLAISPLTSLAQQDAVDKALSEFNQTLTVDAANRFFALLNQEQFTEEKLQFSSRVPADSVRQQVWYWATEWYYDKQDYNKGKDYGLKALPLYHGASESKADCLNLLGCVFVRLGDFKNAATYAKQCLDIDRASGDHDRISSSMNTLAGIYMAGHQADEAEKLIVQAIEHADLANNPGRKAILLGTASEIYHSLTQEEKALDYAQQAYEMEQQLGRALPAAYRLDQKASALMGLKRYQEAEQALRQAIPVMREQGDMHSLAIASNHLGTCLIWQKRNDEAYPYYREACDLFVKMGDPFNEMYSRRGLCLSLWESNPDSARSELNRFNFLKDSLYTSESAEALARMNAEFGNDQLTQANEQERNAHIRDLVLAIASLLLLAAAALWFINRQRKRQQRHINKLVREIERLKAEGEAASQPTEDITVVDPEQPAEAAPSSIVDVTENEFLKQVIDYVNVHMEGGNVGMEEIASHFSLSVSTLRRRLQDATGVPPKSYIQAIQMQRACNLLDSGLQVADVARKCGFNEPGSFSRTFKRVLGLTPTQYRTKS
ncbi:MAG: helix-turn-helix domain-containing protein [Muribaculaceae bacterium]|nr:helix-turn-helix domain-containing protein [Muribaculaceae bacterium]